MKIKLINQHFNPCSSTDDELIIKNRITTLIPARGSAIVRTGISVDVDDGYLGLVSVDAALHNAHDIYFFKTIEQENNKELKIKVYNNSNYDYIIHRWDTLGKINFIELPKVRIDTEVMTDL